MPLIRDRDQIRELLETDRSWAAYALGDLDPQLFEQCCWYCAPYGLEAIALLYKGFETPVLFTLGQESPVTYLLDEMAQERFYLSIRPEILPAVRQRYTIENEQPMWRMVFNAPEQIEEPQSAAVKLSAADLGALQELYADGIASGEAPDCFSASMLDSGTYFGIFEEEKLLCAAGTHLVVPLEGVAAIGNVYTRSDQRGKGLGTIVTSAVVYELLRPQIPTIVLNVKQQNTAAMRVYQNIGFRRYCMFYEGLASKKG